MSVLQFTWRVLLKCRFSSRTWQRPGFYPAHRPCSSCSSLSGTFSSKDLGTFPIASILLTFSCFSNWLQDCKCRSYFLIGLLFVVKTVSLSTTELISPHILSNHVPPHSTFPGLSHSALIHVTSGCEPFHRT